MGYCPFLGLYRDREFSVATKNAGPLLRLWSLVVTRSSGQALYPALTRTTSMRTSPRCACDSDATVRSRQSFWALCRDRVLRVATWFPGQQRGLGRDRGFLYRDRDFLALCHDRNSVSRQGLGMGQAWVVKRVSLCRDRVFPRLGHSCRDRVSKGGVATGCFFVATHRPGLRA